MNAAAAALVYAAVTALLFRELLPDLTTHLYSDVRDPLLNAAILAWNATEVPLTDAWWNFPSFAPLTGVTAFTEHLLLTYPIATPLIRATGNPILAYNVVFLLAPVLNGLAAYALAREIIPRASAAEASAKAAAFVGGLAYAFAPYQSVHLSHLQTMTAFGPPVALLGLHRYVIGGRRSGLPLLALGWLITTFSNAYALAFFPVLVVLWCAWFVRPADWRRLIAPAVTLALATLPVLPLLWGYRVRQAAHGLVRDYTEIQAFSAGIGGLAGLYHRAVAWQRLLPHNFDEGALFPGFTIVALAVMAIVVAMKRTNRRDAVVFWGVAAVVLWLLALGPEPAWSMAGDAPIYGPYRLLMAVPGFDRIRVPARMWLLAILCLAMLAAVGAQWLLNRYPRRARALLAAMTIAVVAEGWFADGVERVPAPMRAGVIPRGAVVLDLPMDEGFWNAVPQYRAVRGGYRSINGYSGYEPPHFLPLRRAIADFNPTVFDAYRRTADLYVILRPGETPRVSAWIRERPGIQHLYDVGDTAIYRLPRVPNAGAPQNTLSTR